MTFISLLAEESSVTLLEQVDTVNISTLVCVMCYLTTRGDSPVKRSQPLVVFGINSGSLDERKRETERDRERDHTDPVSTSAYMHKKEENGGNVYTTNLLQAL